MSDPLWPHELQQVRLPCPSPTPEACSNSCPSSRWCHTTISSSVVHFSCLQLSQNHWVFSSESVLYIKWPKYCSFSFSTSPSNEYSGLISFRMNWLDLLAVQETLKSLLQHHSSKASILLCSAFFLSFFFFFLIFIWPCRVLVAACQIFDLRSLIFTVECRIFQLWHVGSSSQDRDQTWVPCFGIM